MDYLLQKENFKQWLIKTKKGLPYNPNTLVSYTEGVNDKVQEIIDLSTNSTVKQLEPNIYAYQTVEDFDNFYQLLKNDPNFDIVNRTGLAQPNWLKTPLNHYRKFLLEQETVNNDDFNDKEINQMNIPLNQILYGPPGTGKTYKTKEIINNIIKNNKHKKGINFDFSNMTWHEAIAIGMYNHNQDWYSIKELKAIAEIQMIYEIKSNKNLGSALWTYMPQHTSPNVETVKYPNRREPFLFEKNTDSQWKLTEEGKRYVEENLSNYIHGQNSDEKIEYCKFITFHQSYSYEEFIEGIKPVINDNEERSSVSYEYNRGVFKEICLNANSDPDNNYVIVIDEINRGNISKIFGELITLIEPDKRVIPNGEYSFENTEELNNQLLVTLPYSQKKFGVPQNLYIIGTMNTSDRSIASIDIALRRRFKFIEMMPQKELVADFGVNFDEIFAKLNTKIKILLDRDHQIGHSYFIKTKYENADINVLKIIWFSEIIPLLNEYFYCDWEKLKLIIPGFIQKTDVPETLKNECDEPIYYEFKTIEDFKDNDVFKKALNQEKFE